jgi:hypothetical protein
MARFRDDQVGMYLTHSDQMTDFMYMINRDWKDRGVQTMLHFHKINHKCNDKCGLRSGNADS